MSGLIRCACAGLTVLAGMLVSCCAADAAAPAAGLAIRAVSGPTIFSAEHVGTGGTPDSYRLTVTNTGSKPTDGSPITISDELPRGLVPVRLEGDAPSSNTPAACETATATCTYSAPLQPGEELVVVVATQVLPGTVGPVTDSAFVSGGGAPAASVNVATAIGTAEESAATPFGLASLVDEVTGPDGLSDPRAGEHPYETTLSFSLNTVDVGTIAPGFESSYLPAGGRRGTKGLTRDVVVEVPTGFVGDPEAVEKCPQYKIASQSCPPSTQIGFAKLTLTARGDNDGSVPPTPVYNVIPDKGYPAEFVIVDERFSIPLYVSVTPDSNYGVRIITPGIPATGYANPVDVSVTFFGTPATDANVNNHYREAVHGAAPLAFLDNPVDCSAGPQLARVSVDSWAEPGSYLADGQPNFADSRWRSLSTTLFPSLTGCELLQFNPSLTVTPDTTQADEPAGTTVDLHVPQAPQQFPATVTPEFRDTTVTLPSGLSISPSAGDGLQGCTDAQIDLSSALPGTCPTGSQVGTLKVTTPLLSEPLEGQVYLGTPHCDPCADADASDGNMYRIFLQFEGAGVVVKTEGKIYANTSTGQLTTTFKELPQLPVSDVQLHFNSGLRAALATPQACGTFMSSADLTPWSAPVTPDATPSSQFAVDWDGNGEACPATLPFAPSFSAGTSNPNAGQLSPLTVTFGREDREQDFSQIKVMTPPGLLGSLSSVTLCGEPQADLGTCSAVSQIGKMTVAAGPGSHPYYQQGEIYLTGPYKGAPFGLSIVVPTHAGPFNLGNVVVRAQISVDPHTTALTVTTDPLPQILDGIPLRLRTTNVTIDRPGFIFNPTDCAQQQITATVSGSQGTQAQESVPFAVSGCAGLHFGPKFSVAVSGKTSRLNGASLDAKLVLPTGPQSNIARVKVELPKQLPSRLPTLQKACLDKVFEANPAACPPASLIGAVQAVTPILPVKLRGPIYFVSHGGEAFPDLVAVLQGDGVSVDLVGNTFISTKGITSSTFNYVPDVPVSSFELFLPEGPYSALAANVNLCKSKQLEMPSVFTAQDGARLKQNTPIKITGCPANKKARAAGKRRASRTSRQAHGTQRRSK
jgi:Domain of unknown function DUF11